MIALACILGSIAILSYTALVDSFGRGPCARRNSSTLAITDDRGQTHQQGELQ